VFAKKMFSKDGNRYICRNVFFLILDDGKDPENNTPSTEIQIIEVLALVGVS
jgi:hypothetical protein